MNIEHDTINVAQVADDIGEMRAAIEALTAQLKAHESVLKAIGDGTYLGDRYRVTVSTAERATVAWKKVAEKLGPSTQLVTAHTTKSRVTSVRASAHTKKAA